MVETAAILNQAGERSLVILDEIGRGTATFDGLSIAWATIEHLHETNRCRALFATHFHELTQVAKLAGLPPAVIERAKLVLAKLEAEDRASPRDFDELPLFAATPRPASPRAGAAAADSIIAALAALNPDEMSPREALEALYALKVKAAQDR